MGRIRKGAITLALAAFVGVGCVSLSACNAPWDKGEDNTYSDLVERRDDLRKELNEVEEQINDLLMRKKDVEAVRKAVLDLQRDIQYEEVNGPAALAQIDQISAQIEQLQKDKLLEENEAGSLRASLDLIEKGVVYSVAAQGVEKRVASDPLMEVREVEGNGVTVRVQSAVDFGSMQLVTNQVSTADMLYGDVTVVSDGVKRNCVLGESYSEEEGNVSKKSYVDSFKKDMKEVIDRASDVSYDINEGYKVVSTAEYDGKDLATTIVFDVDDKGRLETYDQTYTKDEQTVATVSVEYSSISSSKFSSILEKAEKTLEQQKAILDGTEEKGE